MKKTTFIFMKATCYTAAWFFVVVGLSIWIKVYRSKPVQPPAVTVQETNTFEFHGTPAPEK